MAYDLIACEVIKQVCYIYDLALTCHCNLHIMKFIPNMYIKDIPILVNFLCHSMTL